jgi:hypothetical protein
MNEVAKMNQRHQDEKSKLEATIKSQKTKAEAILQE